MALVPDQKFSTFAVGGTPTTGDIIVGLRGGINTKFNWVLPGEVNSLTGTANQVLVNGGSGIPMTGDLTLTAPQDIATSSSPIFAAVQTPLLLDANGIRSLGILGSVGAVNYISVINQSTGQAPGFIASGETNTAFAFQTTGTGQFFFQTESNIGLNLISGTGYQHLTQFLFSNTANSRAVTFQDADGTLAFLSDIPAGSPSALTKTDDTNVTITLGGTPATALLQPVSLTLGWSGQLSPIRGGTGINNGANTLTLAGTLATSGAFASTFTMTGATNVTFPTSGTLATTSQLPTPAALTKVDDTNVTLTLGGSPATALLQAASLTLGWTGTLSGTRGGTGVNNGASTITLGGSLTTSGAFASTFTMTGITGVTFPTSGTLATVGNTVSSITGTANQITASASTGAVTLSITSNPILPGTGGVTLPTGNTAARAGGAGTMRFNSQTTVFEATVDGSTWATIETSLTGVTSVSGTTNRITSSGGTTPVIDIAANYVGQTSITTLGTIATGTWQASIIGLTYGGTGANLTASNGGIVYSNATALAVLAGTATAQQLLMSGASTTPQWSTSTYPLTNAVNTLLYASSANVMAALATANSSVLVTSAGGVPSLSTTLPNINIGTPTAGVLTNTTAGGGLRSFQIFISGTAQTYTKPANITSILVEILGGGGGGGGCTGGATASSAGGGGGGGGYARLYIASAASTYTYTVGTGGAGGLAGNNTGTGGNTTTFSASSLQATGGSGGGGKISIPVSSVGGMSVGGGGGIGSNGDINVAGGAGSGGVMIAGGILSGNGGSTVYGAGGLGLNGQAVGNVGGAYGGGGSGGGCGASSQAGGAGANGLIIVWEFS